LCLEAPCRMRKSIRNLPESDGPVSVFGSLKLDIVPRTYRLYAEAARTANMLSVAC
jgi:hypothetical protein